MSANDLLLLAPLASIDLMFGGEIMPKPIIEYKYSHEGIISSLELSMVTAGGYSMSTPVCG